MKVNRLKLLCLLLIIALIPISPVSLKVYAFQFNNALINNGVLTTDFTPNMSGTFSYVLTTVEKGKVDNSVITNPNTGTGIIASNQISCTAYNTETITLDLNNLSLTPGKSYYLQGLHSNGDLYELKFSYGEISSSISQVIGYSNGGLFSFTSQISGTLYTKLVPSAQAVTYTDMLGNPAYQLAHTNTSIYKNHPISVVLKDAAVIAGENYKVYAMMQDQYGVTHSALAMANYQTVGNKLLNTYYDNGTEASTSDDRIVLVFSETITNPGDHNTYKLEFDHNSSSFLNADITMENDVNHFTVTSSGNKVYINLQGFVPSRGYQLIDDPAEFDSGVFRVSVLNPGNVISPKLDSSEANPVRDQSLDHATIMLSDGNNISLNNMVYNNNGTTTTKSDDFITVNFTDDLDISSVTDPFILQADQGNINGFLTADLNFTSGTDFTVSQVSTTAKKLTFTGSGITKLNTLEEGTFRLTLDQFAQNLPNVDPSIKSVNLSYLNDQISLGDLIYNGVPIESVSTSTSSYDALTSYRLFMDSVFSPLLKVVTDNKIGIIVTNDQNLAHNCLVTLIAPSGDTALYSVELEYDPQSLKDLTVNGTTITNFTPIKTSYEYTLPAGTSTVPNIEMSFENSDVVNVTYSPNTTGTLPGTISHSIMVTSNMGTRTYYFTFTAASSQTPSRDDEPPTVVIEPTPTPLAPQTEAAGIEQVNNASTALGTAASSNSENPTDPIVKALDSLTKIVETTYNNQGLTGVLTKLSDSLELVAKDMASPKVDDTKVLKEITDITKAVEGQLGALTNPESALKLVTEYIQAVKLIKDAGRLNTPALDQSVEDILTSTSQKLGTLKLDTPKVDEKGLIVEPEDVNSTIQRQLGFVSQIQNLSDQYFDDSQSRKIVTEITLKLDLPKETENFDVTFKAATVDSLTKSKIEKFSLEINGSKITIPTTDANSKTDLKIIMNFEDTQSGRNGQFSQPELPLAEQQLPKDQQIVDFTVYENNQRVELFQKPIRLTFQLEQFKLQNEDPNTLTILRYDENLRTWSPVGGIVDPDLEIIFVDRSTLSQYTVMKSKKTLSQADQSWAKAEINAMLNKGIIAETTTFAPTALVTRAEFAAWIAKAYGLKDSGKALGFKDVSKTNPNYAAIQAVCQQGIMGGKSKTQFDPNGNLTTEEMAVMVGKVLVLFDDKKSSDKVKSKYLAELKTNQVASWATGDMSLLMELGISKSAALADGKALVTKEVAAAVLMGAYQS